ncbi:hypothetical protein DFJ73DRAFT_766648 [Zopfochytrium polystomum]|nr:hypothetical protein DFJ73DRAFT_766648 [Zopfochytrium polystomum]
MGSNDAAASGTGASSTTRPKVSVVATIGDPDSATASSRVFAAHPILRRSLDTLFTQGAPDYPVLPVFQHTRTGGFVDGARNPLLSFQRGGDARMLSNNLEPGPVVPEVVVLPPKLAPDYSSFVVRLSGDLEIALHRSLESYHDLSSSRTSPFVHGFNGLPGLGPWSIAGVLRVTNNKDTVLERIKVTLDFTANMACKHLVKAELENFTDVSTGLVTKRLQRWRLFEVKPHEIQIERLSATVEKGPRESFYASFRYQLTQVYPPSVDLIALNLNESATNTYYKMMVTVIVPKKGFFKESKVLSLTKDIPVHLYSKQQISEVLQAATRRVETLHARKMEFPWKLSLVHSVLAPSETTFLDITVGALPGTSAFPEIAVVTVEIVEVIGYLRGESKFDASKQVRTHATQKVCERYKFAVSTSPASSAAPASAPLLLSWTRDDTPQLPDTLASQSATLRFFTPPLATTLRDAVRASPAAKQDPQYPASCMNPDGRWHDAVIAHDLRVVLHVLDEKRRVVEVESVVAVSVIGVPREELVRLVDAYPGLLDDVPINDGDEELPTVF